MLVMVDGDSRNRSRREPSAFSRRAARKVRLPWKLSRLSWWSPDHVLICPRSMPASNVSPSNNSEVTTALPPPVSPSMTGVTSSSGGRRLTRRTSNLRSAGNLGSPMRRPEPGLGIGRASRASAVSGRPTRPNTSARVVCQRSLSWTFSRKAARWATKLGHSNSMSSARSSGSASISCPCIANPAMFVFASNRPGFNRLRRSTCWRWTRCE